MSTLDERSAHRRAKLRKRVSQSPSTVPSTSPTPSVPSRSQSPLTLPALLETEQQAPAHSISSLQRPLPCKPSHASQSPEQLLVEDAQRQRLESQLHGILKQLDGTIPQHPSSQQHLESQARSIIQSLDALPPRPCSCPQHRDAAPPPGRAAMYDNQATIDDDRAITDGDRAARNNHGIILEMSGRVPHAYLPAAHHQGRFKTLLCKASRLCQAAEAEIYMAIRIDGRFYVYNSVNPTSQTALEPDVRDEVINVAVTSGVLGYDVNLEE